MVIKAVKSFFTMAVLLIFFFVVYLEFVSPYAKLLPGSKRSQGTLTEDESGRMFLELGGAAGQKPVIVFVTGWCPVCRQLESKLQKLGVPYTRADVEKNAQARAYYEKYLNVHGGGVPFTIVGSKLVPGYQPEAILKALPQVSPVSAVPGEQAV